MVNFFVVLAMNWDAFLNSLRFLLSYCFRYVKPMELILFSYSFYFTFLFLQFLTDDGIRGKILFLLSKSISMIKRFHCNSSPINMSLIMRGFRPGPIQIGL